ncbi:MAG: SurA N-terminal domain-containing protein [Hyphomicrobiales bacterium]
MLDFMRKHAGTWMIKALLFAIVVVFIFWGVGSWTSREQGIVASVNGESISQEAYRDSYNRLLDQVRQSLGSNLSEEVIKALNLPQQALEQLIDRALLKQAAARMKLEVSDDQVSQAIQSIPLFQQGGIFSLRRYEAFLNQQRLTKAAFEEDIRQRLLLQELELLITGSVKVSDSEAEELYKWNNATIKIEFVPIDAERYKNIPVSKEEIAQFFDRMKESYRTKPEIQVRYLRFNPENYTDKITLTEPELRDYYDSNIAHFEIPKTVEARHILIRLPADATAEAVEKARAKIEDILKKARAGQDFAALAQQYSEDEQTKSKGGALGAFSKEAMVQPFADAAFALQPGQISEPVRTRFGWHLIKVEKVNEGRTRSFEEAQAEIRSQLTHERARNLAYDDADAAYDAASAANDLVAAAAARKLDVQTTDFFTRGATVKGVAQGAQFSQVAFQLSPGEISEIQDFGDGYYLLQLADSRPARIPELSEVESSVKQDLIKEKQNEMAHRDAQALLADVKGGVSLEQAAKKLGLSRRTSGFFKRNEAIDGLGNEPEVNRVAFELSERQPLPSEPARTSKGYCVIRFEERKDPAMEGFEQERGQIKERLLQQKKSRAWEVWMTQLRNSSQIDRKKDVARS